MPNETKDIHTVDLTSFPYIFEQNVTVPLKSGPGLVRCNVYRPKGEDTRVPVLVTYGPYGKDIHYKDFHPASYSEVNPEHHSAHSAWETPDPGFWTQHGYAIVRADERGLGQSPGVLDTMSRGTSEAFFDVVEWAAEQPWSSGKVGLLGIRHGLLLLKSREARNWGPDTIEGDLPEDELAANRCDQNEDNLNNKFRDDPYYASKEYHMGDIKVPLLSVANWGGICLHLRGNVEGWTWAGSDMKYLRFITGRHDLPFYYHDEVEIQRGFLDAFLKGEDREGWTVKGKAPKVSVVLRKGDVGYNNAHAEKAYVRRSENEWPIARTQYTQFYLTPQGALDPSAANERLQSKLSYKALGTLDTPQLLHFETRPFEVETEITGHVVARLHVSATPYSTSETIPTDIDLFVTLRHTSAEGKEVFYTGTAGDPVPLTKGWQRVSLRKIDHTHHKNRPWLPHRNYTSADVQPVITGEVYPVDIEIWPTNVVVEKGGKIVFEVSSGDTQGCGSQLRSEGSTGVNMAQSLQAVREAAIDGRMHNVIYRQLQLESLQKTLFEHANAIQKAISKDSGHSANETAIEYLLAMDNLNNHYQSLDYKSTLNDEYAILKGEDRDGRQEPFGIVYIVPTNYTLFYSVIVAVSAAIAAGNCVVIELQNTLQTVPALLRKLLKSSLDHSVIEFVSSRASDEDLGPHKIHLYQEKSETSLHTMDINNVKLSSPSSGRTIAVVDRTADLRKTAEALVTARFSFSGNSPYAPDIVFVNEFVKKPFIVALMNAAVNLTANLSSNDSDKQKRNKGTIQELDSLVQGGTERDGVNVISSLGRGRVVEVTSRNSPLLNAKISGCNLVLHGIRSLDDAIDLSNSNQNLLASYLFSDAGSAKYLSQFITSRVSFINQIPIEILGKFI
ncbi:Isoleucine--tRNA ligase [Talaromyces islandicus]|uniref:Isoleucine--tRNA ligase n=1 Tax=Talaromyces islandicus TaxID=28573 RepID=A0A0U1LK99_TALIS|nr:Isoleucine--tRNA ligase [Talaromyces islandicus]